MDMGSDNRLGEFLKARRGLVQPSDHGLDGGGRRRVPGLRREEVAELAGVSVEHYVRLEQGRDRNPSPAVIDSLARVFLLDDDASARLHELAWPDGRGRPEPWTSPEEVNPRLRRMMDGWELNAAQILGRRFDILAANPLGAALFPTTNLARFVFEPEARDFFPDWEAVAVTTVAGLRTVGDPGDPVLATMVADLGEASREFRRLWDRRDLITERPDEATRINHPEVGSLTVTNETFTVTGAPGQQLVVYQAEPGSPSEHTLTILGIIAADPARQSPYR